MKEMLDNTVDYEKLCIFMSVGAGKKIATVEYLIKHIKECVTGLKKLNELEEFNPSGSLIEEAEEHIRYNEFMLKHMQDWVVKNK